MIGRATATSQVAYILVRDRLIDLAALESKGRIFLSNTATADLGRACIETAAEFRAGAAAELAARSRRASNGTTEPHPAPDPAASGPPDGSIARLRVAEVAERWNCSQEWVRRLCRGDLEATKVAGLGWLIDIDSVVEYEESRRAS